MLLLANDATSTKKIPVSLGFLISLKYLLNYCKEVSGPSRLALISLGYVTVFHMHLFYSEVSVKGMNSSIKKVHSEYNNITYLDC